MVFTLQSVKIYTKSLHPWYVLYIYQPLLVNMAAAILVLRFFDLPTNCNKDTLGGFVLINVSYLTYKKS